MPENQSSDSYVRERSWSLTIKSANVASVPTLSRTSLLLLYLMFSSPASGSAVPRSKLFHSSTEPVAWPHKEAEVLIVWPPDAKSRLIVKDPDAG